MDLLRQWVAFFFVFSVVCLTGCSNRATPKEDGTLLDITVTFRGPVDLAHFRYYVVFSPNAAPLFPSPISSDYLPVPGATFDANNSYFKAKSAGLSYYYQTFFSSWSDFISLTSDRGIVTSKLVSSHALGFSATTTQNLSYQATDGFSFQSLRIDGSVMHLSIPLSYLPRTQNQLYFTILVSQSVDFTQSGEIRDGLELVSPVISLSSGSKIDLRRDADDSSISAAADIISWEAQVR